MEARNDMVRRQTVERRRNNRLQLQFNILPMPSLALLFCLFHFSYGAVCIYFNDRCYYFNRTVTANYAEALEICRSGNNELVSIHDKATNQFVQELDPNGVLIGLRYYGEEGLFKWSDGSTVDFTNLDGNFFAWRQYFGDCVKNVGGVWKNAECETDKLEFVCQEEGLGLF